MPETKPGLRECVEAEREAMRRRFLDTCPDGTCTVCAPLRAARAATDEAVGRVEARIAELEKQLRNCRTLLNDVGFE